MISLIGNDSPIEFMNFPDGESFVKFDYNNKPINILWRYENDAEFMTLAQMYWIMNRVDRDARMPKNLFIPYLPHARQDREAASNQPFSLAITMVFLQSTVLPLLLVIRASSSNCNKMLVTSGCAFSISSNSKMLKGFLLMSDISLPPPTLPSSKPTYPGGAPIKLLTVCFS